MRAWLLAVSMSLSACGGAPAAPDAAKVAPASVVISDARARAVPPGAPSSAVFFAVKNDGDATAIVGVDAPGVAGRAELHTHTADESGVMQMRKIDRVDVPAHGVVTFEPGGLHVMLLDLKAPLAEGGAVDLTLTLDGGATLPVKAPVVDLRSGHGAHGAHAATAAAAEGGEATCGCGKPASECSCGGHAEGGGHGEGAAAGGCANHGEGGCDCAKGAEGGGEGCGGGCGKHGDDAAVFGEHEGCAGHDAAH